MNIITAASALDEIGAADAGIVAILGYGVVFVGLIALMLVVIAFGKLFSAKRKKAVELAAPIEEVPAPPAPTAPGAAGQLKLHNVPPKTAAMLMAIVAEKMEKPINELRFISIREVQ